MFLALGIWGLGVVASRDSCVFVFLRGGGVGAFGCALGCWCFGVSGVSVSVAGLQHSLTLNPKP